MPRLKYSTIERAGIYNTLALLRFFSKFSFFYDAHSVGYVRNKKMKIYKKAAAAPEGFGQNNAQS